MLRVSKGLLALRAASQQMQQPVINKGTPSPSDEKKRRGGSGAAILSQVSLHACIYACLCVFACMHGFSKC